MDWLKDYVPWYVWLFFSVGGTGAIVAALIVFVPSTLPFLLRVWAALPGWVKLLFLAIGGAFIAYLSGRNEGRQAEQERQRQRDSRATKAREVEEQRVKTLPDSSVDKELDDGGWFRSEPTKGVKK